MSSKDCSFEGILPKIPLLENFQIVEKLGQGSFGTIYSAILKKINPKGKNFPTQYAIKIETFDPNNSISLSNRTLSREAKFLFTLKDLPGFPRIFYCSSFHDRTVMIIEKLGDSLENIFNKLDKKFGLQTVVLIAEQALQRLEVLSQKGIVHRDLKPDNFLLDSQKPNLIHLIDFGLSKKFLKETGEHIETQKGVGLVGTPRYTSINSHLGLQQSRRDDLESLGYILVYFLKGKLPWMNIHVQKSAMLNSEIKNTVILKKKQGTTLEALCENLPIEFLEYFSYVKKLKFDETPDYQMLIRKFRGLLKDQKEAHLFEWESVKFNSKKSSEPNLPLRKKDALILIKSERNSENIEKIQNNRNLEITEVLWKSNAGQTSRLPRKSCNGEEKNNLSFEDKINANFINDVSVQDEELNAINQTVISRKIVFQPLRNFFVKNCCVTEEENLENLSDEEDTRMTSIGSLMKYLDSQKKPRKINFQNRIMN